MVYSASKKLAETAAWDYAREHGLELVALNPPMIYGPALQDSATGPKALNTSAGMIYQLFSGEVKEVPEDRLPLFVDVRGTLLFFLPAPIHSLLVHLSSSLPPSSPSSKDRH